MKFSLRYLPTVIALVTANPIGLALADDYAKPPLSLAKTYHANLDLSRYAVSEKYDGARAWWDGKQFLSRNGYVYTAPTWFTEGFPAQSLDGELWIGRGRFEQLMATIRDTVPNDDAWRQVRYMVFDAPLSGGSFNQRQQKLATLIGTNRADTMTVVPQRSINTHGELQQLLKEFTQSGAEGLMLQRTDLDYLSGRHGGLLKLKTHQDAEATVIKHLPGKGKYRNLMGSMVVENESGIQFRIGTGFSDAQRAAPPPIGSQISYRYQGYTRNGKPRFARFLRIRPTE